MFTGPARVLIISAALLGGITRTASENPDSPRVISMTHFFDLTGNGHPERLELRIADTESSGVHYRFAVFVADTLNYENEWFEFEYNNCSDGKVPLSWQEMNTFSETFFSQDAFLPLDSLYFYDWTSSEGFTRLDSMKAGDLEGYWQLENDYAGCDDPRLGIYRQLLTEYQGDRVLANKRAIAVWTQMNLRHPITFTYCYCIYPNEKGIADEECRFDMSITIAWSEEDSRFYEILYGP